MEEPEGALSNRSRHPWTLPGWGLLPQPDQILGLPALPFLQGRAGSIAWAAPIYWAGFIYSGVW